MSFVNASAIAFIASVVLGGLLIEFCKGKWVLPVAVTQLVIACSAFIISIVKGMP